LHLHPRTQGQVFPRCAVRGAKLPLEGGDYLPPYSFATEKPAEAILIEAGKPVPEPYKVDLHSLVEGLARRIDVGPPLSFMSRRCFMSKKEKQRIRPPGPNGGGAG